MDRLNDDPEVSSNIKTVEEWGKNGVSDLYCRLVLSDLLIDAEGMLI